MKNLIQGNYVHLGLAIVFVSVAFLWGSWVGNLDTAEDTQQQTQQEIQTRVEKSGATVDTLIQARQVGTTVYVAVIQTGDLKCLVTYRTMDEGINQDCYKAGQAVPDTKLRQEVD